jgi:uronate dehydrogenase
MPTPLSSVLITGAAGTLGRVLAPALQPLAARLLLSDRAAALAGLPPLPGAQYLACELADGAAVRQLLTGVDAVVHLGGVSVEGPFEAILQANILGLHQLYEGARRQGVRRIVFASSNHVTGCWPRAQTLAYTDRPRPDGNYGLSKLFGEGLASLYWDRHGIETVCLRIGTATPTPPDARALATWLSLPDLARLVTAALTAPAVGCTVVWGMSANSRAFWQDDGTWARLGYHPQDNAEAYAAQVQHLLQPEGPMRESQGGAFLGMGPYDT